MTIKNSSQKSAAQKLIKVNFLSCNGCYGRFPAAGMFQAPKNKHGLKLVCKGCFKQYIGSHTPVPSVSSNASKNKFGSLITKGNEGVFIIAGKDGPGFMGMNSGTFMGQNTGTFMGHNGGTLISESGSTLIGTDGASLIGTDGAS